MYGNIAWGAYHHNLVLLQKRLKILKIINKNPIILLMRENPLILRQFIFYGCPVHHQSFQKPLSKLFTESKSTTRNNNSRIQLRKSHKATSD